MSATQRLMRFNMGMGDLGEKINYSRGLDLYVGPIKRKWRDA
jgi:hypothetical protein